MYVITNRKIQEDAAGLKKFGPDPNDRGPNELRLANVTRSGNSYRVEFLKDQLTPEDIEEIEQKYDVVLDPSKPWFASAKVAVEVLAEAEKTQKQILFFVHGYNNDMKDILQTAHDLENTYNVIVVVFSWPSNGGGSVSGTLAYLSDKDDARVSATAFDRFAEKVRSYHEMISRSRADALMQQAIDKHPDNLQKAQQLVTRLINEQCQISLNLLCHSMGNYLLKYALIPGNTSFRKLIFDNICLVAADANNEGHAGWVDRMDFRKRLYIVINEDDYALAWSRRKPGDEQKVRLGHSLSGLNSRKAKYIDVTKADWVNNEHSYFQGEPVEKNIRLRRLFADLFEGRAAELNPDVDLHFRMSENSYAIE